MFAVVKYYNYKESTLKILHIFSNYDTAEKIAFDYAKKKYGNKIVNDIKWEGLHLYDSLITYTSGDGYDKIVYAVIELPEPEPEEEEEPEAEDKKMSGGKRKSPKRKSPKRKSPKRKSPKRKSPKKMSGGKRKSPKKSSKVLSKQSGGLKKRSYFYQRTRQLHGEQGPVIAKCPRGKKMAKNGRCFKKRKSIKPKKI